MNTICKSPLKKGNGFITVRIKGSKSKREVMENFPGAVIKRMSRNKLIFTLSTTKVLSRMTGFNVSFKVIIRSSFS